MLGLVATGKRSIRSGAEYDKYFVEVVEGKEVELKADGDVYDTLELMKKIVKQTLSQTKAIAVVIKGSSREATCRNLWNFLYNHVQYKKDNPLREQLRTPARTWRDRKTGVDCDCYSIFISSVLTNLKIPHSFRMAGYDGEFQHVYVVVPAKEKISDRASYYVIDPVVNQFNFEAQFSKKHDTKMSQVTMLSGFGACNSKPEILRLRPFIDTQEVIDRGGIPTKEFLVQNGIPFVPSFDETNYRAVYVVTMADGKQKAWPTVLAPGQEQELKNSAGTCVAVAVDKPSQASIIPADVIEKIKRAPWWIWAALAAGGWILFTGSDQNEVQSGLNGLDKVKKKALKAISI